MKIKIADELVAIGDLNEAFLATWTSQDTPWTSGKLTGGWGRGWPSAANTGPAAAPDYPGALTPHDGSPILSNSTYSFKSFDGLEIGSAATPVHNVHFHGCAINDTAVNAALVKLYADGPVALTYCELGPSVAFEQDVMVPFADSVQYGITFSGAFSTFHDWLLLDSCLLYGYGNAVDTGNPGSSLTKPVTMRHCALLTAAQDGFDTGEASPYHTDGIGHLSGLGGEAYMLIEHNTIESLGNTNGIALQAGVYDHITVRQNLLGGYGFTVAIWNNPALGLATNTTFTDNVFSTRLRPTFGPLYAMDFYTAPGSVWARNRLLVPDDAAWGDPAHSGRYWIPTPGLDLQDFAFDSARISSLVDYAP